MCFPFSRRTLLLAAAVLCAASGRAMADNWAERMFDSTSHDFGVVARGATVECTFSLENKYVEDVHIASVRSSCGCTTPTVDNTLLKTWQRAEIKATVDTRGYFGRKDATITVEFDQPFAAEVQLHVHTFIRSDVVVQPGSLNFGAVDRGATATQSVKVDYAGRNDWRIERLEIPVDFIEAVAVETERQADRVTYELRATLKPNAPPGHFQEHLVLVTNDTAADASRVPVRVEGIVAPAVRAHPSMLNFGVVASEGTVTRSVVVQGKTPFRIVRISCADERVQADTPTEALSVHAIPVTFSAGLVGGKVETKLIIETDHPECKQLTVPVIAQVGAQADGFATPNAAIRPNAP